MLKRIPVGELRLGMFVHGLCGPWFAHPMWRTRFRLDDPADLERLRSSGIAECLIDTARGPDASAPAAPPVAPVPPVPPVAPVAPVAAMPADTVPGPARAPAAGVPATPRRQPLEQELPQAARLRAQARAQVASLHEDARLGRALDLERCAPLVDEIAASMQRNAGALLGLVRLKAHDDYTFMHSVAVCTLMVVLARRLGHDEAQVREAGLAGLLHDLGKAGIPLAVLNKPGKLTPDEYRLMQAHPRLGVEMLRASGLTAAAALDVCLHHHERPDGRGYPAGLAGDAFTPLARMAAVCDVYDAITSNRPYKAGWSPDESIARMATWTREGKFDPAMFRAFVDCVGIYPVGSLVRLKSQRLAVVVEHLPQAPTAPRVKVFYSIRAQMQQPPELVDLSQPGCREQIVGRESNRQWRFPFLDTLAAPDDGGRRAA